MIPSLQSAAVENVAEREWVTGAEDFSYYGTKAPSSFFILAECQKEMILKKLHHIILLNFILMKAGMKTGIKAFCDLVIDYMNMQSHYSNEEAILIYENDSFISMFISLFYTAQKTDKKLQSKIEEAIQGFNGDIGIYIKNLRTGKTVSINADTIFPQPVL